MAMSRTLLSAAVLLLLSSAADAQGRAIVAAGPSDLLRAPIAVDTVRRRIQPTHWKEGAAVGGLVGGIGLALVVSALCRYSDAAGSGCAGAVPAGFLVGGIAGGVSGALIGGQFPKKADP
jgi:hypothetical protein